MADRLILVFGRTGQVGTELAQHRLPEGWSSRSLSRREVDLTDRERIAEAIGSFAPVAVINAAAYTAVDAAEEDMGQAMAINRDAPAQMAAACHLRNIPLLHVSTDYVFDGHKDAPYTEDDPVSPVSVYGASKAAGEAAIRSRTDAFLILRTSWVFSPFGRNFVRTMIKLVDAPTVEVVNDQTGAPTAAADIAHVLLTLAVRLVDGGCDSGYGTFHYTGGGSTTWYGFASAIFSDLTARGRRTPQLLPIKTEEYLAPAQRPSNSRLDCSRIVAVHGIRLRPWREALAICLAELAG
jgi:dTDP-4-dehydrorhamnose reductase